MSIASVTIDNRTVRSGVPFRVMGPMETTLDADCGRIATLTGRYMIESHPASDGNYYGWLPVAPDEQGDDVQERITKAIVQLRSVIEGPFLEISSLSAEGLVEQLAPHDAATRIAGLRLPLFDLEHWNGYGDDGSTLPFVLEIERVFPNPEVTVGDIVLKVETVRQEAARAAKWKTFDPLLRKMIRACFKDKLVPDLIIPCIDPEAEQARLATGRAVQAEIDQFIQGLWRLYVREEVGDAEAKPFTQVVAAFTDTMALMERYQRALQA